jgi:hypothetical protein
VTWAFSHDNSYNAEAEREAREMKWLALAIITALTVGLLLLAGTAEGKATRISFTAEETSCIPTSPGTSWYADGTLHIRGYTQVCDHAGSIPQVDGTDYEVLNLNLDATGSGVIWGTWRLEVEGGSWEGVHHGKIAGLLTPGQYGTARGVGHGTGIYEGQQYFTESVSTLGLTAGAGYILVP